MRLLASKVEVAVLEPDLLGVFLLASDRHWKLSGRGLDRHIARPYLDFARREIRVSGLRRPGDDLAFDRHDRFDTDTVKRLECG